MGLPLEESDKYRADQSVLAISAQGRELQESSVSWRWV